MYHTGCASDSVSQCDTEGKENNNAKSMRQKTPSRSLRHGQVELAHRTCHGERARERAEI